MAKGRSNKVRIIGGTHGGRVISFPNARGLRPTADRVRETLFNWLRVDIEGARCLDLFAGSGVLGLEALSRGADSVLFVDQSRAAVRQLEDNICLLGVEAKGEVRSGDALKLLQSSPDEPFRLVFLDPPFAEGLLQNTCVLLEENGWLADNALIYLEQDSNHVWPDLPDNWQLHRETKAGQASCRLMRRAV